MFPTTNVRRVFYTAPVFAFLSFSFASALADEVLEEIIVTADFRERTARELPLSISVLDRETISAAAVQHFEELVFSVPNMNLSGDGHRARYFQIRGVGELEQYEGAPNPSIGFLIDDIDFSGIGTIATLFDVQQIEVLRGPQGTRYGANALGGLIYVQSAEPTSEWDGVAQVSAGNEDAFSAGLAIGGPVTADGKLKFRVSAHHHESNGFRDNAYLQRDDTNGRNETSLRGKLVWEPTEDWQIVMSAIYADVDNGYDAFAIDNSLNVLSDKPGKDAQKSSGASVKAIWSGAETFNVTSITTSANSDIEFGFDADWGNPDSWLPYTYDFVVDNDRERQTISQEFRLTSADAGKLFNGSTDWLLGVYVMQLDDDLDSMTRGILIDPDPVFGYTFTVDDQFAGRYEALNAAIFGQLDFAIGDTNHLGFGLRVERRNTDYTNTSGLAFSPDETMIGGELTFTHDFSDFTTGFISLARGFKAGGFNPGPGVPDERRQFDTETVWNLEVGMKSRWLDESLQLNTAIFYSDRQDQQIRTSFQLVPNDPASFVFFTDNADQGRTIGLEVDLRWLASDEFEYFLTAGLLDAEITSFGTSEVNLDGRNQAHAPAYTLNVGGIYRRANGFFARLDVSARDEFYFDYSHNQRSSAYELVNARLGFEADRWTVQLWMRNLFDERYAVRGFYFGNEPPDFSNELYVRYGDPRQIGVTLDMRF
jgi:outer membrane receptor protein involved in Fe transport